MDACYIFPESLYYYTRTNQMNIVILGNKRFSVQHFKSKKNYEQKYPTYNLKLPPINPSKLSTVLSAQQPTAFYACFGFFSLCASEHLYSVHGCCNILSLDISHYPENKSKYEHVTVIDYYMQP